MFWTKKYIILIICSAFCITPYPFRTSAKTVESSTLSSAESNIFFSIQVVVLSYKGEAETLVLKLKEKGYPAYIAELKAQDGQTLYRVRIGRYGSDTDAYKASQDFNTREKQSGIIVKIQESSFPASTSINMPPDASGSVNTPPAPAAPEDMQHAPSATSPAPEESLIRTVSSGAEKKPPAVPEAQIPSSLHDKISALAENKVPREQNDQPDVDSTPDNQRQNGFALQVGTEIDKSAAERSAAALRRKGYPARVFETKTTGGKSLYRLRIGTYKTEAEGERAALQFQTREKKSCLIVDTEDTTFIQVAGDNPAMDSVPAPKKDPALEDFSDEEHLPEESVTDNEQAAAKQPDTAGAEQQIPKRAAVEEKRQEQSAPAAASPTKIFAYRDPGGALNLTNNYFGIPETLRGNIEYISLFPVICLAINNNGTGLLCNVEGKQTEIVLAGVTMPPKNQTQYLSDYIARNLNNIPLRLKYNPSETGKNGAIVGKLYLKEGTFINLDVIRKGLARCLLETLPPDQHGEFQKSESLAQKEKLGIWGGSRN